MTSHGMSSGLSLLDGTRVRLCGLRKRPELNDCTGTVRGYRNDRYRVELDAGLLPSQKDPTLLPANLQIISLPLRGESAPEASHGEACVPHTTPHTTPTASARRDPPRNNWLSPTAPTALTWPRLGGADASAPSWTSAPTMATRCSRGLATS